ncbi:hypothetical protein ACJDT4_23055 [Clostridium neuense]|uniref:MATE family efflux transporter n=1 Tax=Clostridium neuense TaxID=1728934 RepID=A0ABW8TMI0_9CLOT
MKKIEKIDFTCGDITKNILSMVIPLTIALLFNTSGTIVDSLWVGNLVGELAMATVFSQAFTMLVSSFYMFKGKITLSMKTFDFKILKAIVKQAVPSIVQQSMPPLSTSFVTSVVTGFGVAAISGFGVAGKIETLLLLPPMAFNMVLTSCVGQCFGIGGSSAVFVKNYFMIISVGYICNVITNCALGVINGYGKSSVSMFLMFFYYVIVRIPLAFILSKTSLMLNGIWIAVLISHVAALIAANIYLYHKFKKVGNDIILED